MTSGSDDFLLTLNVWSFKSRHVELGTFEIPVIGGASGYLSCSLLFNHKRAMNRDWRLKTFKCRNFMIEWAQRILLESNALPFRLESSGKAYI